MSYKTNIIASFNFEGNSNDNFGSITGTDTAITYSTGNGKILQGAGFNGTTSFINYGNVLTQATGKFSISFWIKGTGVTRQGLITKCESSAQGYYIDMLADGRLRFGITQFDNSNVYSVRDSLVAVNNGNWHHVLVVRTSTAGVPSIYIDGVLRNGALLSVGTVTNSGTASNLLLGKTPGAWGSLFNGSLDVIQFFNDDISLDVLKLYNNGNGRQYSFYNSNFLIIL